MSDKGTVLASKYLEDPLIKINTLVEGIGTWSRVVTEATGHLPCDKDATLSAQKSAV